MVYFSINALKWAHIQSFQFCCCYLRLSSFLKFRSSQKATKSFENQRILQNHSRSMEYIKWNIKKVLVPFLAFSEYLNFSSHTHSLSLSLSFRWQVLQNFFHLFTRYRRGSKSNRRRRRKQNRAHSGQTKNKTMHLDKKKNKIDHGSILSHINFQ